MMDLSNFENMRDVAVKAIMDLASKDKNVVMLDADLKGCLGSGKFEKAYPGRFFNTGIAEQNMIAMAAGMASVGLVPFTHTFGCFASRRVFDQVYISVAYAKNTVHMIGTDPGVVAQLNGGTHMALEDVALMRTVPDLVVYEPSDAYSLYSLIREVYKNKKSSYLRLPRKGISFRYSENDTFKIGKAKVVKEGGDIAIFALGQLMMDEATKAAEVLEKEHNLSVTLVDLLSIKPLDEQTIIKYARKTKRVVVCENARQAGGVGEAIATMLLKNGIKVKAGFVNAGDVFGEVGKLDYLKTQFNLDSASIVSTALSL